ncbi:hypothetical protein HBI04_192770 [Parastagonospora nodorum]|nr:hypothetical protein HBI03_202920 [Parastagonospora nodorum]KAH4263305.1 hypothetical protein HBI04_192770 [Parastagonospora nodorum]KAH5068704.1 hypothetical protein HBH95_191130 [Parastagonospora nodorum]KAH5337432.1 hypothetical protein HBI50_021890 [Parastagonospora nodorum]KAH5428138.1 hypothetical protein HBI46_016270 [Parastagonospora nodorum]
MTTQQTAWHFTQSKAGDSANLSSLEAHSMWTAGTTPPDIQTPVYFETPTGNLLILFSYKVRALNRTRLPARPLVLTKICPDCRIMAWPYTDPDAYERNYG